MKKEIKIYVLLCPISSKIKYIGRTSNDLIVRLRGHLSKAKQNNTPKNKWILSLKNKNLKPIIKLYKVLNCSWEESHLIERDLIQKCIKYKFDLKNLDDRGEGFQNRNLSDLQKLKISNSLKEKYKNGFTIKENLKPVSLYDLEGNLINSFDSIKNCAIYLKPDNVKAGIRGIEKCLYNPNKNKSYLKYQIRYSNQNVPTKYTTNMHKFNLKKCILINTQTNIIFNFESISELCKFFNTTHNNIKLYFNNNKLYKKYYIIQVPQLKKTLLNGETLEKDNPVLN